MCDEWDLIINKLNESNDKYVSTYASNNLENINLKLDRSLDFKFKKKSNKCVECDGQIISLDLIQYCKDCGIETGNLSSSTEDHYSVSATNECNVYNNGFMSIKITGNGSYGYQKSLYKERTDVDCPLPLPPTYVSETPTLGLQYDI